MDKSTAEQCRAVAKAAVDAGRYRSEQEKYHAKALIDEVFDRAIRQGEPPLLVLFATLMKYQVATSGWLTDEEKELEDGLIDVEMEQMLYAKPLDLLMWYTSYMLRMANSVPEIDPVYKGNLTSVLLTQQLLLDCIIATCPLRTPDTPTDRR